MSSIAERQERLKRWLGVCRDARSRAERLTASNKIDNAPPHRPIRNIYLDFVVVFFETKVSPGGLNYDEVVVYTEKAALPTNLIVYSFYE